MARCKLTCVGTAPLLMHSARLANPLDPVTREMKSMTSKRKKTDEDHEAIARLEHAGNMYYDPQAGPYIPGDNLRKTLIEGARKSKQGKLIEQGVFIETLVNPLAYHGPRDLEGLWADKQFVDTRPVKVQTSRLMRTRPIFTTWAVDVTLTYDPLLLNYAELERIAATAGAYIGLGDNRPLYGRFRASLEELVDAA